MWDLPQESSKPSKATEYYNYETNEWINPTPARKREFYSMKANIKSPNTTWGTPIVNHPTDFSNFNDGRRWNYDKILREYRKHHPEVTEEQVKYHVKTILGITIANPRFIPAEELPEFDSVPTDFSDCILPDGNHWDWDKISELYAEHGITKDLARRHFKDVAKVTIAKPFYKSKKNMWAVPAKLLGKQYSGTIVIDGNAEHDPKMQDAPYHKEEIQLFNYLLERHNKKAVQRYIWKYHNVHVEI